MRILLVAPYFYDSFAGKISMGSAVMAAQQLSRRHEVLVVTTGREKSKEVVSQRLTVLSAPGVLLPDPINYVISPQALMLVARQIRIFQPDLVIVNKFMFFTSFAAPLAKWMGKPTIFVTDTYPGLNWFPRNRFVAAVMWLYARALGVPLLRSVDKVVVLHEGLTDIAEKYKLNYLVIHNGKDLSEADAAPPAADLDKTADEVWISYVGRLESVKGYDFLLEAVEPLHDRYPNLKTFYIGASVPEGLPTPPGVHFLGFRNDVFSVLKKMDIFCLPSLNEGLPNSLMEAMSVRCACIASRVGGVPYLIEHEKSGLLVPPRDPQALREAIARLIENPDERIKLGESARSTIEARFNWARIIESYEDLFRNLLNEHHDHGRLTALNERQPMASSATHNREDR
jgi:glycosyltransferase involved in cell wall biosynthesis